MGLNQGLWAKSGLPAFANKVLLEHSHSPHHPWLFCLYNGKFEQLLQRWYGLQSLKYLLWTTEESLSTSAIDNEQLLVTPDKYHSQNGRTRSRLSSNPGAHQRIISLELKTFLSLWKFQKIQELCLMNLSQRPNGRTKDAHSTLITQETTRILGAPCHKLEAENNIYIFLLVSQDLIYICG